MQTINQKTGNHKNTEYNITVKKGESSNRYFRAVYSPIEILDDSFEIRRVIYKIYLIGHTKSVER